jgi:hypothetical protein
MSKRAISVTLEESNLTWLQGLTRRGGARSVSDAIDRLISEARTARAGGDPTARSVAGTIDIDQSDLELTLAGVTVRDLFDRSLTRPFLAREGPRATIPPSRKRRRRD